MVQVLRLLQVNRPTVSDTTVSLRPVARRADAMNATGLCDVGMVDHTVILELDPYVCFFGGTFWRVRDWISRDDFCQL